MEFWLGDNRSQIHGYRRASNASGADRVHRSRSTRVLQTQRSSTNHFNRWCQSRADDGGKLPYLALEPIRIILSPVDRKRRNADGGDRVAL